MEQTSCHNQAAHEGYLMQWILAFVLPQLGREEQHRINRLSCLQPPGYKTYQLPFLHHCSCSPLFSMLAFDPRIYLHSKVVVHYECNKGTTAYVFSSEKGREWRRLELEAVNNISNTRLPPKEQFCINGYAYRLGTVHENMDISDPNLETSHLVVLKFHIEEEPLELISIPPTDHVAKLLYHVHSFSKGSRVGLGMTGGCLLYIAQVEREMSIWRPEDQGQCRRWDWWRSISLHLLKHESMLRPSYVPAWNGHEEALYFIALESLCRNSTKDRIQELICGWEQLAGSQRPPALISFMCCAHDPAIKSVLS